MFPALLAIVMTVVAAEWVLWRLFTRKVVDISLPHEMDTSYFRFFTMPRMRMFVLAHAGAVIVGAALPILLLW